MAMAGDLLEPPTIGALASRLIEDGRAFLTAEVKVYKEEALVRVNGLKSAVILFVLAAALALAALVTLLVGFANGLAVLVGPAGGGAIVAGVTLLIAGLLGWIGARKLSAPAQGAKS